MPAPNDPIKRAQWIANVSAAMTGRKLSPEHIAKMSSSNKIAMNKPETLAKLSVANCGEKNPRFGTKHSAETLSKMSASQQEAQNRPEVKAKKSASMKDRKLSSEHKEKLSAAKKGKKLSSERCTEISFSNKKRYEDPEERAKTSASAKKSWENLERRAKRSVAWLGENNPLFVDGSCCNGSSAGYNINFTYEFRNSIRERDGHVCQLCNEIEEQNGESLSVHHIFYDGETNDCSNPDDFVSLCRSCHVKTNVNRAYWRYYFLDQLCFPMV